MTTHSASAIENAIDHQTSDPAVSQGGGGEGTPIVGILYVKVLRGASFKKGNPYVILNLTNDSVSPINKTSVYHGNADPEWNEEFTMYVQDHGSQWLDIWVQDAAKIQQNLENLHAHEMLKELKTLFAQQAEQELLQTMREFHSCKLEEGQSRKGTTSTRNRNPNWLLGGQNQGKGKNKLAYAPKPKIPPPPKREDPAKDSICHQCGETGIFTIELYTFPNKSWVYDTGCGTHIYNTTQGLRGSRKLKPCALSLYVGNGQRAAVEAIGSYHLSLPSRLVIILNNFFRNNMVYFSAVPRDGIFEINLSDSYTNVSSIYALSNKRAKSNLDSALLWHCRLGHISKKRIEKLQHDALLNSTNLMAFEKCVPCMSGKMATKPYTHQVERAKDLLGLIHTDVCGPFKIMSRQGASYFVTFTDDFSSYGYVYLLKHKHEVFETFKVF
ncbi:retrotransposon protein, putative, ty1-copia subclass [Tanacetum coccineum]